MFSEKKSIKFTDICCIKGKTGYQSEEKWQQLVAKYYIN